jgi:hypothetical protein
MLKNGGNWSGAFGANGEFFVLYCEESYRHDLQKRYARSEPVRIRYADRTYNVQQQYLAGLNKQNYLASTIAHTSPVTLYENLMSALTGTDLGSYKDFRSQVKDHTNLIIEYIRSKTENFSSLSYFTPTKEEEHLEFVEKAKQTYRKGTPKDSHKKFEEFRNQKIKNMPFLNLNDLPRFTYRHENLTSIIQRTVSQTTLLLLINILFFALSFVAFMKYDIR